MDEHQRRQLDEEARQAFERIGESMKPEDQRGNYPQESSTQEADQRRQVTTGPDKYGQSGFGRGSQAGGGASTATQTRQQQAQQQGRQAQQGRQRAILSGSANGQQVDIRGATLWTNAQDASVRGWNGYVNSQGNVDIKGWNGVSVSKGRTNLTGGAPIVVSGDTVQIDKGGSAIAVGRKLKVQENGFVGISISGKTKVEKGGKVLLGTGSAIALGAAFGAAFAGVSALIASGLVARLWTSDTGKQLRQSGMRSLSSVGRQGKRALSSAQKEAGRVMKQARSEAKRLQKQARKSLG